MDCSFPVPWAWANLWFCLLTWGPLLWAESSQEHQLSLSLLPHTLLTDGFYFPLLQTALSCCHRQIRSWLLCTLLFNTLGKMSLLVGIWVPEQINKKEKWCMSGMMMWRERLGHKDDWEVYPSLLPIDTTPQAARSAPCSLSVRMMGILLTLEWKELLGAPCFPASVRWCS